MLQITKEDAEQLLRVIAEDCDPVYAYTYFSLFIFERQKYPRASFEYIWDRLPSRTSDVVDAICRKNMVN